MVIDVNGMSHRPKGLPRHEAGAYESRTGTGMGADDIQPPAPPDARTLPDPDTLDPKRYGHKRAVRPSNWLIERDPSVLWDARNLKADTIRADGTDHRHEPVLDPAGEMLLISRSVYREEPDGSRRYGRIMRSLQPWFPNEAECRDIAYRVATGRLMALRRRIVASRLDPEHMGPADRTYSPMLAAATLNQPVRMESILAQPPYNLSAHRMRAARRYLAALNAYRAAHRGANPPQGERDLMWDRHLDEYVTGKEEKDVSYGRGLYYSNGLNARDARPDGTPRHPGTPAPTRRTGADGRPYNARLVFDRMLSDCRTRLKRPDPDGAASTVDRAAFEQWERETMDAAPVLRDGMDPETVRGAWRLARSQRMDMGLFRERMGLDRHVTDQWDREDMGDASDV